MLEARVTPRGAARWRRGHPWIYESDLLERPAGGAGAVRVLDAGGRFQGLALWSPRSRISLRLLSREDEGVGSEFWTAHLDAAVRRRESAGLDGLGSTTAYRLVHGEADGLPSLIVDRYGEVVVAQFLSAGLEPYRNEIVAALLGRLTPAGVLGRNDAPVRAHEGLPRVVEALWGHVPEQVDVLEAGRSYRVSPWSGQKTGGFLDQRENRIRAGELARGRVLDAFAYQGNFSIQAAAGAEEVLAIDSSGEALARARENAGLNGFQNIFTVEANVFDFLRQAESAGERFDVVILDPPAFAKRRETVSRALAGYKEINLRAMLLLAAGGHLCTFSCSYHVNAARFRDMLVAAAMDAGRPIRWVEARGQSGDHPEVLQIPESGYLKGAILQAMD